MKAVFVRIDSITYSVVQTDKLYKLSQNNIHLYFTKEMVLVNTRTT